MEKKRKTPRPRCVGAYLHHLHTLFIRHSAVSFNGGEASSLGSTPQHRLPELTPAGTARIQAGCNKYVYVFISDLADVMKGTTTVCISGAAHQKLRELAEEDGVRLTEELDRIVEAQRRRRFIE